MMDYEERNMRNKGYGRFRALLHLSMGVFYILIGIVVFNMRSFGQIELSTPVAIGLGIFFILYGVFRIWRGWADNKIMNSERKRP